jgi:hypothetical protein
MQEIAGGMLAQDGPAVRYDCRAQRKGAIQVSKKSSWWSRVFDVTIHYRESQAMLSVVAPNDQEAREKAIQNEAGAYKAQGLSQPKVEFCEVVFVRDVV